MPAETHEEEADQDSLNRAVAPEELPAPAETANEDEKTLVARFIEAKDRADTLKAQLDLIEKERDALEDRLIKLLEDDEKSASAHYDELGHVTIIEGAAYASIEKGRQGEVLDYLTDVGRSDMIKTSVHSATLSTYVRECLKQNQDLPPGVSFYRPKFLRRYK